MRHHPQAASTGALHLDAINRVVSIEGASYPVTPEQLRILAVLARRCGGFVKEDELRRRDAPGASPAETIRRMPAAVRALIECKRGPGGGRRLMRPVRIACPEEYTGELTPESTTVCSASARARCDHNGGSIHDHYLPTDCDAPPGKP